jgi:hypothetical protein
MGYELQMHMVVASDGQTREDYQQNIGWISNRVV